MPKFHWFTYPADPSDANRVLPERPLIKVGSSEGAGRKFCGNPPSSWNDGERPLSGLTYCARPKKPFAEMLESPLMLLGSKNIPYPARITVLSVRENAIPTRGPNWRQFVSQILLEPSWPGPEP